MRRRIRAALCGSILHRERVVDRPIRATQTASSTANSHHVSGRRIRKTDDVTGDILTDGVVTLRPSAPEDASHIIAARDDAFRRFIGQGSDVPAPEYVIVVGGCVVGWVDHDRDDDRWWLAPEEVNIGYHVFPEHRGVGYATRAVHLMLEHLRADTHWEFATLLIHPDNTASLKVAERNGFERASDVEGRTFWRRGVREIS
jgi:RimJ/RimL family protein N-acetyltransferase